MINKEVIEIKNISEIKSNIVNYDVFDDNIVIATEKNEFFLTKYDIKIEEEIIEKIQTLATRLQDNSNFVNREIKLFNNGFIFTAVYSLLFVVLSLLLLSPIPLIFLISSGFIGCKLMYVLKEYKDELKQINLDLDNLKSILDIKKMELNRKKSAEKCNKKISEQSDEKIDSKLLRELREELVEEPKEEKDKTMTKHK